MAMQIKYILSCTLVIFLSLRVSAQEISTFNGLWGAEFYQDNQEISKSELESLLKTNPEAYSMWNKHKRYTGFGIISAGVQIGFGAWYIMRRKDDESIAVPFIGFAAATATTIVFIISADSHKKNAFLNYNQGLDEGVSLKLGPTYNGYGFVYSF